MGFIYKITNNVNGKFYIGKTSRTIGYRFSTHKSASVSPKDFFHRALKKYGVENFSIVCIKEVREDDDINETGEYGRTLMHQAVEADDYDTVCHLANNGADLKKTDNNGHTPSQFAIVLGGRDKIVAYLVEIEKRQK